MYDAIIPVAGLGTRSLPASKVIPKEMLPIFDRPIIQYIVEEAVQSGAQNVILVTSKGKTAIEDHFDYSPELENALQKSGKTQLLNQVVKVGQLIEIKTVRQKEQKGLGHAVLMARSLVQKSPFAVLLGDDMIEGQVPGVKQLFNFYESRLASSKPESGVVLLMEVPEGEVSKYGICELLSDGSGQVKRCVEKPKPSETLSRLAIIGRYLLPRSVFDLIEKQPKGALGEIQLTDSLNSLAQQGRLFGCVLQGQRFDAGDRLGFLEANIHYYLKNEALRSQVIELLKEVVK